MSVPNRPDRFNFTRDVVEVLAADPARPALTHVAPDGVIDRQTFAEVAGHASRWANLLRAHGLEEGDRVLVHVGRVPGWHATMLGALKAGVVAVPCSEMLRARDLSYRAAHSGARLIVTERRSEAEVARMEPQIATLYLDEATSELRAYPASAEPADTKAGHPALILYTSGTTKEPRGAVHTHGYTWAQRMQAEQWLDAREGDLVWCTAGTGWAKAIWNVLLGPWSMGAEVVIHDAAFDPVDRFALLERLGVTVLCQSPTEYRLMAKVEGIEEMALPHLRHAVSAGEPLNPEVIKVFSDVFGLVIRDGYGQTENTLLVANLRDAEVRPGSMGRPTPGHDVHVIDEHGTRLPPGEEGEIALLGRPPALFAGYWDDAEATRQSFRGDYYLTGDRAVVDADGFFWFAGRADDVIGSAAYRIGPFEVESALLEHAAVAESAVVAKPDPDRGHIVKAFVVLRPGYEASAALAAELREHVKSVTAPYKYPREVEFVASLPKTSSGKIRRVELRELELERYRAAGPAAAPRAAERTGVADDLARARELRRLGIEARAPAPAAPVQPGEEDELEQEARRRLAAAEREAERLEAERRAAHEADLARREDERRAAARLEVERAEQERREAEALAAALLAAEREEADRKEAERQEAQRAEAERRAAVRREAERDDAERREAERSDADRAAAQRAEAERLAAERAEAERREAERREAERREAAERAEAERREAERLEAQRQEAIRAKAEREARARREAEVRESELREAARLERERVEAEQREAARLEAEQAAAARAEAERREAEHIESELREIRRQEAERRAARQRAEAERDAELLEAKRNEADAMRAERLRTEQRLLEERRVAPAASAPRGLDPAPDPAAGAEPVTSGTDEAEEEANRSLIERLRAYRVHDDESDEGT